MEKVSQYILFLTIYNVVFFWKFYTKPFLNATGELLSTHFPHWIWLGRRLRAGEDIHRDKIFFYYPSSIPVLSTFYPLHELSAWLCRLKTDHAFILLHYMVLAHYILYSILSFLMFHQWYSAEVSLFGAITLTYMASSIRIQNPCTAYTLAWIPGMFIHGWLGQVSFGMAILGGYYPTLVYMTPWAILLNPSCLLGLLVGYPQLLRFLRYYPKTIRMKQKVDPKFGSIPIRRFLDLLFPGFTGYINGVLHYESTMFMGWLPLIFIPFSHSRSWIPVLMCAVMMLGKFPVPFRVPARFTYPFAFFLVWMATNGISHFDVTLGIIGFQAFCLLRNNSLYPLWPFCEWQRKPSEWFDKQITQDELKQFPYFTGYFHEMETVGYTGGFSMRETCERNGITNPMGERCVR